MSSKPHQGFGLGLLPPPVRLVLVVGSTIYLPFTESLFLIMVTAIGGLILLLLNNQLPNKFLFLFGPISTGILFFVGNLVFSPPAFNSEELSILGVVFRINEIGLHRGILAGLRIFAVLCISLAWLKSTSSVLIDLYYSLAPFIGGFLRKGLLLALHGLQIQIYDFTLIAHSLKIRGMRFDTLLTILRKGQWKQLRGNFWTFRSLFIAVIPRLFFQISQGTISWAFHNITSFNTTKKNIAIKTEALTVKFPRSQHPSIMDINLEIASGSFVLVVGPDASGKTTLLQALAGVIPRVHGLVSGKENIKVQGITTTDYKTITLKKMAGLVGYVGQGTFSAIIGLTVGQEMCLLAGDATSAHHFLSIMGISDLWDQQTTMLSGGQQVRLILACLLASNADLLVLDQPMDQLDPEGRSAFIRELIRLNKELGKTIVLVDCHFKEFINDITDVIELKEGKIAGHHNASILNNPFFLSKFGPPQPSAISIQASNPTNEVIGELVDVHVSLASNEVLKGINFRIHRGECVMVTGANGSGKTTAMLTLAGAIPPTHGRTWVSGNVACIFQDPRLQMITRRAYKEIEVVPRLRGYDPSRVRRIVEEGLSWAEIDPWTSPLDLTQRQCKMLAIAATNIETDLIILDEPSVGLDKKGIIKIIELVENLLSRKKAALVISHDEYFFRMAHRVVRFERGYMSELGA